MTYRLKQLFNWTLTEVMNSEHAGELLTQPNSVTIPLFSSSERRTTNDLIMKACRYSVHSPLSEEELPSGGLPCSAGAGGLTALLVLLGSLLTIAEFLLIVGIEVGTLVFFGFRLELGVHVEHVFALLHLLQELVHGLEEDAQSHSRNL